MSEVVDTKQGLLCKRGCTALHTYSRAAVKTGFIPQPKVGSMSVFIELKHINQCQLFMNLTFYRRNLNTGFCYPEIG